MPDPEPDGTLTRNAGTPWCWHQFYLDKQKMIPAFDLESFWAALPLFLIFAAALLIGSAYADHLLNSVELRRGGEQAFQILKTVLTSHGIVIDQENREALTIRSKRIMKFYQFLLYQYWSRDITFRIEEGGSGPTLTVKCRGNPFRYCASENNPKYISRARLDGIVQEVVSAVV